MHRDLVFVGTPDGPWLPVFMDRQIARLELRQDGEPTATPAGVTGLTLFVQRRRGAGAARRGADGSLELVELEQLDPGSLRLLEQLEQAAEQLWKAAR